MAPKATDPALENKQLSLPFRLKSIPDTRTRFQRMAAAASTATGCVLAPITLPIHAAEFAHRSLKHLFNDTRIGRITARTLPAVSISISVIRSCNDYQVIEEQRKEYIEQHSLSDEEISYILNLPHIDRDNSMDRTQLVTIGENIENPSVVEATIGSLFDELYTVESRKTALDEILRVINASEISEELKIQYRTFAIRESQTSDELPAQTWVDSIRLIHDYGHETKLVESLIPLMFENVRTPQGSLTMTHILLESFQMNNALTPDQRTHYQYIVDQEFKKFQKRFGDNVAQTLSDKGLLDIVSTEFLPVQIIDSNSTAFAPYTIDTDKLKLVETVEEQLDFERAAFVDLMREHQKWVLTKLPENSSEELKETIVHRDESFLLAYPTNFQTFASQLEENEYFGARVVQSYTVMTDDFDRLNTSFIGTYKNDLSLGTIGASGFLGMITANWILPEAGLAYGFYAGAGSAALFTPNNISETYYYHREPLTFALPGEGIMYDSPRDGSIF